MRRTIQIALLPLLMFVAFYAKATPISYSLNFVVGYLGCADCAPNPIDPRVQIGSVYHGDFTVDDSILGADGINKSGTVAGFRIQMEEFVWDSNLSFPLSSFTGFRGPQGFSASPGFDVIGGAIVNLRGGVFGIADFPFVDFSTDTRIAGNGNVCGSNTLNCGNAANAFWTVNQLGAFGGAVLVHRIPEPSTLLCMLIGLFGVVLDQRRWLRHT